MRRPFARAVIIYNPKSTGSSKRNALTLQHALSADAPELDVELIATTHAGHAEEIAAEFARRDRPVLLVSASGDGGYNELINGVLAQPSTDVYCAVLPSGNANDHAAATGERALHKRIITPKLHQIDVLKITGTTNGKPITRYAHSYAGIGVSAYIGKQLTANELNPVNEKWLALKYLLRFRHVTIRLRARTQRYSSLVVGNIDRMSKVLKLGKSTSPHDGKFEIYSTRYRSLARIVAMLVIGSTFGLDETRKARELSFTTTHPLELQCDGEIMHFDAGTRVRISCQAGALHTLR